MGLNAKITAYNYSSSNGGCSDFSLSTYWGNGYKNVIYLDGDLSRSEFKNTIETTLDVKGQEHRTQDVSIERFSLSMVAYSPILSLLHSISKHDVKTITFIDTGDVYVIKNIDINDQGSPLDTVQIVNIVFEDEPISKTDTSSTVLNSQKLAYWDNNNDGTADIDGVSAWQSSVYRSWQLYYESDGVTPATSGGVKLFAYAVSQTGLESLVGIFSGELGDLFSDSTKWQSSQQIWDYFNVADSVGHTNRCEFDKEAYAQDNGYYSDETDERAVDLRFELSIDGSTQQKTTLALVYYMFGALNLFGVQDSGTGVYGVTTVGDFGIAPSLSTIQDIRTPLAGGASALSSSAILNSVTTTTKKYTIGIAAANEQSYQGVFSTRAGYVGSCFRGAYGNDNYTFSINELSPPSNSRAPLIYSGVSPYIINFSTKYDRQVGGHGFPFLGDIALAGDAKYSLDGVVLGNFPAIAPASTLVITPVSITLPDTLVHTVKLYAPTTGGYEIFTEFEVQIKPLF
jgi:hypothetical protein